MFVSHNLQIKYQDQSNTSFFKLLCTLYTTIVSKIRKDVSILIISNKQLSLVPHQRFFITKGQFSLLDLQYRVSLLRSALLKYEINANLNLIQSHNRLLQKYSGGVNREVDVNGPCLL